MIYISLDAECFSCREALVIICQLKNKNLNIIQYIYVPPRNYIPLRPAKF